MKPVYLLLMLFASLNNLRSQESGFPFIRNYTPKEYKGEPQVFSMIQDQRGVMYFDGGTMILEYDGLSWRKIPFGDEANSPYDFAMDENGKIYVGASDEFGYLASDTKGYTVYKSLIGLLPDSARQIGTVWYVNIAGGNVYFTTSDVVFRYSPVTEKISLFKAGEGGRFAGPFVQQGVYHVRLSKKGLVCIVGNEMKNAAGSDFFQDKIPYLAALPYGGDTTLIVSRTDGLFLYKDAKTASPAVFALQDKNYLQDNEIYTGAAFQKGRFLIGSFKGALMFDAQGNSLQHYDESVLLQNNDINKIFPDAGQNIWFGLSNGISKSEHGKDLSYWDKNAGLNGTVYKVTRFNGTIYIATDTKVYFIDPNNRIKEIGNIPTGQNWCFSEDKSTNTLFVGASEGVYEIQGERAVQVYKGENAHFIHFSDKKSKRMFTDDFSGFISLRFENGKWVSEGLWEGVKDDMRGMSEDGNGDIWIGTYGNGVIRISPDHGAITKPKSVRYYTQKDGFASLKNILPFKYKDLTVWGTENGLYTYNPKTDRFEPFCELGSRFCDGKRDVFSLQELQDGTIWVSPLENEKADIGYLKPNGKGAYSWVYAPFRRIPQMHLEAFYIEPSGIAWVGGSEGLYRYDRHKDTKDYEQPFFCLIRKATAGTDSLLFAGNAATKPLPAGDTKLGYELNSLKFEFAAPFFDQEEKTVYSYRLIGYQNGWTSWASEGSANYTNLPEGDYEFQAKAKNIYGTESQTGVYRFRVLPPWHRTWWAYSLYIFFMACAVIGIVRLNTRRLKQDKIRLEGIIAERTAEVVQQKEEILNQNEELHQQQEELVMLNENLEGQKKTLEITYEQLKTTGEQLEKSIRYAFHIQSVVMPENAELEGFFSEVFVLFKPKDVVSGDFYWFSKIEDNKCVFALADCTGHGVPGAFMSMLACTLLHEIVNIKKIQDDPARVLKNIHSAIQKILKQTEGKNDDGMDISVCCFEKMSTRETKLIFAGAKSKMAYIHDTNLTELNGDKQFLGGRARLAKNFTNQEVVMPATTIFYLFTDGFSDQNDSERKKLGISRFKDLLIDVSKLPLSDQKEFLEKALELHRGAEAQRDDISVVGLRF